MNIDTFLPTLLRCVPPTINFHMEAHSGSRRKIRQSPLGGLPLQTSTAASPGITSRNFNTCFFNLKLQAPLSSFLTVTNNKPVHVIFLKPRNVGIFLQARSQRKGRNNHGHRVRGVSFALEVQAVLKTMGGGRGEQQGACLKTLCKRHLNCPFPTTSRSGSA